MSFGSRLRERREAVHLTQKDLGLLLGVSGNAVGNYEKGLSSPNADALYKVFDALQCDANYLFQDEMAELNEKGNQSTKDEALLNSFHQLNDEGQEKVVDYSDDLVQSGKYIKTDSPELGEKKA